MDEPRSFRTRFRNDPVEADLSPFRIVLKEIRSTENDMAGLSESQRYQTATSLRDRALRGESADELLVETFALVRIIAESVLGMRPFDVQVLAGIALHRGRIVEMATGEGKTLAAVLPACLNALSGRGVHILTFNDYLARRDTAWMGPVYQAMGLRVGTIQAGMRTARRREGYDADVVYATAREAGFDFLRMNLARSAFEQVQRPFHFAVVDEADSILIDEARVPLVIAGDRPASDMSPYRIAEVAATLDESTHWDTDETGRNVFLTDRGVDRVEKSLGCGTLHDPENYLLLTEVNQALHARVLLHRDVDYLVQDGRIALVDEFTGRIVEDRRWPDGLQAALEAKEGLEIQPGGRLLGSIALPHFLAQYPRLCGMTATAQPAADELLRLYGLKVVPIPSNRPCVRDDLADVIFTHREAKERALVAEIRRTHAGGRPVLVGTRSVEESERLASRLFSDGVNCRVLNAKNDEAEADIIAGAGAPGAVTISTNMAGRGTDIRLGGPDEADRDRAIETGGLYVIGTNRHESRRIDDQLRGRAGRQGDPGTTRYFVSLDDDLMVRYGIDSLIPPALRPGPKLEPLDVPFIHREVDRVQRIAEGQNREIRTTGWRYSSLLEKQRKTLHDWRAVLLTGMESPEIYAAARPDRFADLVRELGEAAVVEAERIVTLHHVDACWAEHLAYAGELREGIHLVGLGGQDPLYEFHRQLGIAYRGLHEEIRRRVVATLDSVRLVDGKFDLEGAGVTGSSSTWTYLVNDQVLGNIQQMLFGPGSSAFAAGAVLMTWPFLAVWALWRWLKR